MIHQEETSELPQKETMSLHTPSRPSHGSFGKIQPNNDMIIEEEEDEDDDVLNDAEVVVAESRLDTEATDKQQGGHLPNIVGRSSVISLTDQQT